MTKTPEEHFLGGFPFPRKNPKKYKSFSCNFGKIGYSIPQTNGRTPNRRYIYGI